jgi:hypothetical protein
MSKRRRRWFRSGVCFSQSSQSFYGKAQRAASVDIAIVLAEGLQHTSSTRGLRVHSGIHFFKFKNWARVCRALLPDGYGLLAFARSKEDLCFQTAALCAFS